MSYSIQLQCLNTVVNNLTKTFLPVSLLRVDIASFHDV